MLASCLRPLLAVCCFFTLFLGGCTPGIDDRGIDNFPKPTPAGLLSTGIWRLDQIRQDGQTTGTGAAIKDQYSLTFFSSGKYTQKLLADNTTYEGTWKLTDTNTMLHLTDNKGTENVYTVVNLTATELRYSFTNKAKQAEERIFSAQP
jgi:hypothetical protein